MAKPSFEQNRLDQPFQADLQLQGQSVSRVLANRLLAKLPRPKPTPPLSPSSVPAYPAALPIEGINESPSAPAVERAERSPQPPPQRPPDAPEEKKPWHWSLVWLGALGVLGGMGTAALIWLVSLPPQIDCRKPERLSLDMERLYCAQEAAQSGELPKLIAGIELLKQWQPDHPLHRESQRLIQDWSDQVLTHATRKVEKGDLKGAEAAISHIPNSVPVYEDAQKSIQRWRKYSQEASKMYDQAQKALKQREWSVVSEQIVRLAEFERDYWDLEKGSMVVAQQLGVEKRAWQILSRAQKLASTGSLSQIGAAIPVAQQVPTTTYAATTAKENLKQWSKALVSAGSQQWQKGDQRGTLITFNPVAQIKVTPETEDLFKFSNAYRLAYPAINEQWTPGVGVIVNLTEAIAALEQVKPTSPFYTQAQALKENWQAQLQDLVQLKYASVTANLGQLSTLNLAIGQAKQVNAERPRRRQAQGLIASWQRQAERIEDQPILDRAVRVAKSGNIKALQAAMQQASRVELGRALRGRAQTWIATWRSQIQTLEDQPILNQAWDLAQQGNLEAAIKKASAIQSNRALYAEAQSAVGEWRYQQIANAQIAQDQPILDRAYALADSGKLSAAISTAAQISSGRALSSQAQSAITRWENQLRPPAPAPLPRSNESTNWYNDPLTPLETGSSNDDAGNELDETPFWLEPASESNAEASPSPTPEGESSFPNPSGSPAAPAPIPTPPESSLTPAPGSYEPIAPSSEPAPATPSAIELAPPFPTNEPALPPIDPLPPSADPLPPLP